MSDMAHALRMIRYTNKAFWRNPANAFFTFAFPLMFLVIFTGLFGNDNITVAGREISVSTFYVSAIAAFSIITATYTNLAINVSFTRDAGVLKRIRGSPLPGWAFMAGRIGHAILVTILLVAIVVTFGTLFYDAEVPTRTLPAFLTTIAVGAAAFSGPGSGAHWRDPQRRRLPGHRQRLDPAAPVPFGHLHPDPGPERLVRHRGEVLPRVSLRRGHEVGVLLAHGKRIRRRGPPGPRSLGPRGGDPCRAVLLVGTAALMHARPS